MAIRKQLVLPFAALLFSGIVVANAADRTNLSDQDEDKVDSGIVSEQLAKGEEALKSLLGSEVTTLDALLRPMIHELAETYGVSEEELSKVAKEVMVKIANMDLETLQATLGQLAGFSGLDINNMDALQELLGRMETSPPSGDGI